MLRDITARVKVAETIAPAAHTATATGTGVDTAGFDSAAVVLHLGDWTDGTHTFAVEDSDDNATFAAVAVADLDGAAPAVSSEAGDDTVTVLGYKAAKRFLRVVNTVTGAPVTGLVAGAVVLLGHPRTAPTS